MSPITYIGDKLPSDFTWTGVGTRYPPQSAVEQANQLGALFTRLGGILQTGEAIGMDAAFRWGVDYVDSTRKRVYTVKDKEWCARRTGFYASRLFATWERAEEIAARIHPNWSACKRNPWAAALHTRNVFQVLSETLSDPVEFLICYAKPAGKLRVDGGTNTAVMLAQEWGIPVYNLYHEETFSLLLEKFHVPTNEQRQSAPPSQSQ